VALTISQNKQQPDTPVLEIRNLTFGYDQALLNIDAFTLAQQESIAVLGPSGCGKTTFMHLLTGLLRPDAGSIQINGTEITTLSEAKIDQLRGQQIGIVFQRMHLIPSISILDNLLLAQRLARVPSDKTYAIGLLEQLGIADLGNRRPTTLSQGQVQRAAIARAVAHKPSLLVADEPTSALDDKNARDAITILKDLTIGNSAALIVVTHDERVRASLQRTYDLTTGQ
jgi:putative ABC transport system ATP-binding protein